MRRHRILAAAAAAAAVIGLPASAEPVDYQIPVPPFELAPGPGREVAEANCGACHSSDYIRTQPRTFANPIAFWTAEVVKMQKAYGAPIADADVAQIVAYLAATYGKPGN